MTVCDFGRGDAAGKAFRRLSVIALAAIGVSQICYLILVWTGFLFESLAWRVWWITMLTAVTVTGLVIVRRATIGQSGLVARGDGAG